MAQDGRSGVNRGDVAGDDNVIAETLKEIHAFVDAFDRGGNSSYAAGGKGKIDVETGADVLNNSLSSHYQAMSAVTQGGAGSGNVDVNNVVDGAVESDALQDSEGLISTLGGRYGMASTAGAEGAGSEDNPIDHEDNCNADDTHGEKNAVEDDVSEITKASEDLYNRISQSYNRSDSDGVGAHINPQSQSHTAGNTSVSGSAISGGSSIENRPPPAQQPSINTPSYQSSKQQQSAKFQKLRRYQQYKQGGGSRLTPGRKSVTSAPLSSKQQQGTESQMNTTAAKSSGNPVNEVPEATASSPEAGCEDEQRQSNEAFTAVQPRKGLSLGLQNVGKVSLLLKVGPHPNPTLTGDAGDSDQVDEDGYGPVLFPLMVETEDGQAADEKEEKPVVQQGGVILVNPNAFDAEAEEDEGNRVGGGRKLSGDPGTAANDQSKKRIAGRVTVETARLVAQVSQISSEDWARKYQFDGVIWPPRKSFPLSSPAPNEEAKDDMSVLAAVAVEDIMSSRQRVMMTSDDHVPCSSVICAVGGTSSGKTQTVFGPSVAGLVASATRLGASDGSKLEGTGDGGQRSLGLLGDTVRDILSCAKHEGETTAGAALSTLKCSVSILEIADEDVLRDVLGFTQEDCDEQGGTKALRVRHLDSRGAVVQGLQHVAIESMDQLRLLLHKSFSSRHLRRIWSVEGGHGHFVATVSVTMPDGKGVGTIQLVDLASTDRDAATSAMASRRMGSFRKSLSALRGVLRGIVAQQPPPLAYRESTLTKLLQRCLEDQQGRGDSAGFNRGRVVIVGTVRPSSKAYQQTLATMDFMARLVAKLGDTARSPFESALPTATRLGRMEGKNTRVEATSGSQSVIASSQAALKSITSDPRQRLAKLMNPEPLRKGTAGKRGVVQDSQDSVASPIEGHNADEAKATEGRQPESYGNVFDQLDTLMGNNDDDDSVDRDSYGEGIMEALTPYKGDGSLNDGSSSADSSERMASPLPQLHQSTDKSGRAGRALMRQEQWQKEEEEKSQLHDLFKGLGLKERGSEDEGVRRSLFPGSPPQHLDIEMRQDHMPESASSRKKSASRQPSIVPERRSIHHKQAAAHEIGDPSKTTQRPGENEAQRSKSSVFVKKPNAAAAPLKMLFSLDSMDSELLVSSKGEAQFFAESPKEDAGQLPPVTEVDVPSSPTYAMFDSFQQEIDTLVDDLTSPKELGEVGRMPTTVAPGSSPRSSGRHHQRQDLRACRQVDSVASVVERRDPKSSILEGEIAALKDRVHSLNEEKTVSEAFVGKLQSIMDGKGASPALNDVPSSWPRTLKNLVAEISDKQARATSLQCQLESYHSQRDELTAELQQAERRAAELSQAVDRAERGAAEAMETVDSQARASTNLDAEIKRLRESLESVSAKNAATSDFFGQLDALLGIRNDDASIDDRRRCIFRLDAVQSLKSRLNEGMATLEESLEREQFAESRMQELRSELDRLKESSSRSETKRLETEKLAEEAVAANERLTTEVDDLRGKLLTAQNAHQALLIPHESALHDNEKLSVEYDRARSLLSERDGDIEKLKKSLDTCQEEKRLLESQFAMIKTKTIDIMKQRIGALKSDYGRRLEDFKASYSLEHESGEAARLQHDLSSQEAENAKLRRRIEQIESVSSLSLQNAEQRLAEVVGDLKLAREDASKQNRENRAMKSELDNLRSLMDIAEESVSELNRLKEENKQLNGMIKSQNDHEISSIGVPFEIRGKGVAKVNEEGEEDRFVHERISTLMRENEQNNISMRTLQSENLALKSSIDECSKTIQLMNSEMSDLKAIATDGVSKLRMREQSLLEKRDRDRDALADMERKLEKANNLIASLRSPSARHFETGVQGMRSSSARHYETGVEGMLFNPNERPSTASSGRLTTPNHGLHHEFGHRATPSTSSWNERKFAAELTAEKELRFKAEEIAAGVLANSKAALEERDSEINQLRSKLFQLSNERHTM